jgi:serine/threonine protein kinase
LQRPVKKSSHEVLTDIGIAIEGYRLGRQIGFDAAASLWQAWRIADEKLCVIKTIDFQAVPVSWRKRFVEEHAKVLQVQHPNVVQTYCHGVIADKAFIVLEYLAGGQLRFQLGKPLDIVRSLRFTRQLALGLHALHSKGVVHRDLRPENIMLRDDGSLVLINFAMTTLTSIVSPPAGRDATSQHVAIEKLNGDFDYQSPEQTAGETVDHRSDLFSLGLVLREMLTGQCPARFGPANPRLAAGQDDDFPPLPRAYWRLQPLMDQLLAPRPQQRFASAVELLRALRVELLRYRLQRGL